MSIRFVRAAEANTIQPGEGRTVHAEGFDFAVYNVDGEICVVDDACPHRGASLGEGGLEGNALVCPLHGWSFDPRSGECFSNPNRPLRRYPSRVCDGWIEIGISSNGEEPGSQGPPMDG